MTDLGISPRTIVSGYIRSYLFSKQAKFIFDISKLPEEKRKVCADNIKETRQLIDIIFNEEIEKKDNRKSAIQKLYKKWLESGRPIIF